MATSRPSSAGSTGHGGAGQTVVELCEATAHGMIFWARQRFEVGAELQLRAWAEALPARWSWQKGDARGWVNLRGYVVQCVAERRCDGSFGFRISLLLTVADHAQETAAPLAPTDDAFCDDWEGQKSWRMGWN
jgi:hypothetical protein